MKLFILFYFFATCVLQAQESSAEQTFARIFAGFAQERGINDFSQVILPHSHSLGSELMETAPEDILKELKTRMSNYKMEQVNAPEPINSKKSLELLKKHPITFVIIPGIFSEFIEQKTFHEVFSDKNKKESLYYQKWIERLAKIKDDKIVKDKSFDLEKLTYKTDVGKRLEEHTDGYESLNLADLVEISSVGPIQAITLRTPTLSMESFSKIADLAEIFNRRLEKVFQVLGVPQNIMLVGYSMGAITMLEMLVQAKKNNSSGWLKNVRGATSLGGVVFGTQAADEVFEDPSSASAKQLVALESTAKCLLAARAEKFWSATKQISSCWYQFGVDIKASYGEEAGPETKFNPLNYKSNLVLRPLFQAVGKLYGTLLSNFFKDRDQNIARFYKLAQQAKAGIAQMTTKSRLQWWKENKIPTNGIQYYSLAGTFLAEKVDSSFNLLQSPLGYKQGAADANLQFDGFMKLAVLSGHSLNDGQVCADRVHFWPELIEAVNPEHPRLESHFLGVFPTTHWGLAFPFVTKMKEELDLDNPFPRISLFQSLAALVAYRLEQ